MKVFFDTNVYVAEALRGGGAERAMEATRRAGWRVFVSDYVCDEAERVLVEYLGRSHRYAQVIRKRIARRARRVTDSPSRHQVPRDPDDSPILAAALNAGVDYLVTSDRHLLDMQQYESVRIISLNQYLTLLADAGILS